MTDKDNEFCLALHKLRRDKMQARYGTAVLHNLGPGLIMGDTMLEQIAECARTHKLGSLDDLYEETKWHETWELGDQVLELVSKYVEGQCRVRDRLIFFYGRFYPHSTENFAPLADSNESIVRY